MHKGNSHKRDVCRKDVHRALLVKHTKTKKDLDNEKIILTIYFNEFNESNVTRQKNGP